MTGNSLKYLAILGFFVTSFSMAEIITIDSDISHQKSKIFKHIYKTNFDHGIVAEIDSKDILKLSHQMHEDHGRCGGFVVHETVEEAKEFLKNSLNPPVNNWFVDYQINQQETVNILLKLVQPTMINSVITHLSSYHNRYYKAQSGISSSRWIGELWGGLTENREDANVELYQHERWPQPTVILTIEGESDETIVIGGHADSISGYFGGEHNHAPGADDNASGIATITEVIRVLMLANYKPKKTLKFMAYSAEEVGLLGSREIARLYASNAEKVVGVLQLDMTLYKGSSTQDIALIADYTDQEQNTFLGKLIDTYVKVPWIYDRCGYACSDHASWTGSGFKSSFPFEAKKNDMNRRIHTTRDTLDVTEGSVEHPVKFAKLALSYVVELDQ